jgi:hypothetical protein
MNMAKIEEVRAVRDLLKKGSMGEVEWLGIKNGACWWRIRSDLYLGSTILLSMALVKWLFQNYCIK